MQINNDSTKSSLCCSCPKDFTFQKHILDPKNAAEAIFSAKSKFYLKKTIM
jgi:hypothetical protein